MFTYKTKTDLCHNFKNTNLVHHIENSNNSSMLFMLHIAQETQIYYQYITFRSVHLTELQLIHSIDLFHNSLLVGTFSIIDLDIRFSLIMFNKHNIMFMTILRLDISMTFIFNKL